MVVITRKRSKIGKNQCIEEEERERVQDLTSCQGCGQLKKCTISGRSAIHILTHTHTMDETESYAYSADFVMGECRSLTCPSLTAILQLMMDKFL